MSLPTQYSLPIGVAFAVGIVLSLTRRFTGLFVELSSAPSPELLSWYGFGMRGVAFLLVYGALLGVAYRIESEVRHPNGDAILGVGAGVAGAVGYAIATAATVIFTGIGSPGIAFALVTTIGAGFGTGVELGVVAFAGAAMSRRNWG